MWAACWSQIRNAPAVSESHFSAISEEHISGLIRYNSAIRCYSGFFSCGVYQRIDESLYQNQDLAAIVRISTNIFFLGGATRKKKSSDFRLKPMRLPKIGFSLAAISV